MTNNKLNSGMLAQWKKDKTHWGYHWNEDRHMGIKDYRKKIFDSEIYQNYILESKKFTQSRDVEEKELQSKNLPEKEFDKELLRIYKSYVHKFKELEIQRQVFEFQYCFIVLENVKREWKVGNTILKQQTFWKSMITRRDGNNQFIWVDENDIEPYEEESYKLTNHLLKKHRERINKKL